MGGYDLPGQSNAFGVASEARQNPPYREHIMSFREAIPGSRSFGRVYVQLLQPGLRWG
jgi:hypothetical protein